MTDPPISFWSPGRSGPLFDPGLGLAAIGQGDRLVLQRDPGGQRPLHVRIAADGLVAVSPSALALARWQGVPCADPSTLAQWASRDWTGSSASLFANVRRLRPGERLTIQADGAVRSARTGLADLPAAGGAAALADAFRSAVSGTMAGHQTVAIALSSGLDSSLTAAAAAETRAPGQRLLAIAGGPAGPTADCPPPFIADERPLARDSADRLGLAFTAVVGPADGSLLARHRALLPWIETPFANLANLDWYSGCFAAAATAGASLIFDTGFGNLTLSHDGAADIEDALHRRDLAGVVAALRRHWQHRSGTGLGLAAAALRPGGDHRPAAQRRLDSLALFDNGLVHAGLARRFNLQVSDPSIDPAVLAASLATAESDFAPGGQDRGLAMALLDGAVDPRVARAEILGLQGCDSHWQLQRAAADIATLIADLRGSAVARTIANPDALAATLDRLLAATPGFDLLDEINAFLRIVAVLDFLRWTDDGCPAMLGG